mmetsp:Transcript_72302/g.150840  ORF Transcript_72302/g.150840 Transcript_72302/m.150840 type:complete len:225 (+) Transcript_72302:1188-1862(+)
MSVDVCWWLLLLHGEATGGVGHPAEVAIAMAILSCASVAAWAVEGRRLLAGEGVLGGHLLRLLSPVSLRGGSRCRQSDASNTPCSALGRGRHAGVLVLRLLIFFTVNTLARPQAGHQQLKPSIRFDGRGQQVVVRQEVGKPNHAILAAAQDMCEQAEVVQELVEDRTCVHFALDHEGMANSTEALLEQSRLHLGILSLGVGTHGAESLLDQSIALRGDRPVECP